MGAIANIASLENILSVKSYPEAIQAQIEFYSRAIQSLIDDYQNDNYSQSNLNPEVAGMIEKALTTLSAKNTVYECNKTLNACEHLSLALYHLMK